MSFFKTIFIVLMLAFVMIISGCGFRLRNPSDIPPELHTLYISTNKPYSPFIVELKRALKALNVHLVKSPHEAAIGLKIPDIDYVQHTPDLLTTVVAVRYFTSLNFTAILYHTKNNHVIKKKQFSITRSVLLNTNQALIPNMLLIESKELTHEGVNLLYYWIIATKRIANHHANSIKTTQRTSKKQTCRGVSG